MCAAFTSLLEPRGKAINSEIWGRGQQGISGAACASDCNLVIVFWESTLSPRWGTWFYDNVRRMHQLAFDEAQSLVEDYSFRGRAIDNAVATSAPGVRVTLYTGFFGPVLLPALLARSNPLWRLSLVGGVASVHRPSDTTQGYSLIKDVHYRITSVRSQTDGLQVLQETVVAFLTERPQQTLMIFCLTHAHVDLVHSHLVELAGRNDLATLSPTGMVAVTSKNGELVKYLDQDHSNPVVRVCVTTTASAVGLTAPSCYLVLCFVGCYGMTTLAQAIQRCRRVRVGVTPVGFFELVHVDDMITRSRLGAPGSLQRQRHERESVAFLNPQSLDTKLMLRYVSQSSIDTWSSSGRCLRDQLARLSECSDVCALDSAISLPGEEGCRGQCSFCRPNVSMATVITGRDVATPAVPVVSPPAYDSGGSSAGDGAQPVAPGGSLVAEINDVSRLADRNECCFQAALKTIAAINSNSGAYCCGELDCDGGGAGCGRWTSAWGTSLCVRCTYPQNDHAHQPQSFMQLRPGEGSFSYRGECMPRFAVADKDDRGNDPCCGGCLLPFDVAMAVDRALGRTGRHVVACMANRNARRSFGSRTRFHVTDGARWFLIAIFREFAPLTMTIADYSAALALQNRVIRFYGSFRIMMRDSATRFNRGAQVWSSRQVAQGRELFTEVLSTPDPFPPSFWSCR